MSAVLPSAHGRSAGRDPFAPARPADIVLTGSNELGRWRLSPSNTGVKQ